MDIAHNMTEEMLADLEKRLAVEYRRASREIERKLREYLDQFSVQDEIQRELLRTGAITAKDYSDWRFRHMMMNKRWEEMRNTLAEEYHRINQIAAGIYRGERAGIYALNHNYALYEIEHSAGIDTGLTLYNRDAVERILVQDPKMLPPPGKKVSKRIAEGKDILWNNRQIQSVMVQGILQGESIPKLARRLEQVTERNYTAAVRNARTMATGAQNAGRHDAYERAESIGVQLVQEWVAVLDGRTRHEHRQLHGQRVPVDDPFKIDGYEIRFPGDPTAPGHLVWNCRCTTESWVKGFEGETIKTSPKMGGMSFEEWQNEKSLDKSGGDMVTSARDTSTGSRQRREKREYLDETGGPVPKPVESPEIAQNLKPIVGDHSILDDCRAANPNYSTGLPEWHNNCQRTVTAYEARRRGYDVTALPCHNMLSDRFAIGSGYNLPYESGGRRATALWQSAGLKLGDVRGFTKEQSLSEINKLMLGYGNGSRAIVNGYWKSDGGHLFIAENIAGKIHFIDPQNGSMNCVEYFDRLRPAATTLFRIDDLPFNGNIWEVIRNDVT